MRVCIHNILVLTGNTFLRGGNKTHDAFYGLHYLHDCFKKKSELKITIRRKDYNKSGYYNLLILCGDSRTTHVWPANIT